LTRTSGSTNLRERRPPGCRPPRPSGRWAWRGEGGRLRRMGDRLERVADSGGGAAGGRLGRRDPWPAQGRYPWPARAVASLDGGRLGRPRRGAAPARTGAGRQGGAAPARAGAGRSRAGRRERRDGRGERPGGAGRGGGRCGRRTSGGRRAADGDGVGSGE
jgi:hypothetical protein